jgi:hypothetical protein
VCCDLCRPARSGDDAFRPLGKFHRWFELRATADAPTSPLVRGALAAAFNDPTMAERLLRGVIRDAPRSEAAHDAYGNVSFAIITPGGALADAEIGIIGLPIIVAMGGITFLHTRMPDKP